MVGGKLGRPTLIVNTHNVRFRALLDTGASCSLLRRDIFEQIVGKTHQICHLLKTPRMQAVNGTEIQAIGQTEIQLDLVPEPIKVIIVETLPHDMILGDSVLRNGCAVLDLRNNSLLWYGRKWSIERHGLTGFESIGPIAPQTGNACIDQLVRQNSDVFSAKGERLGDCVLEALTISTKCPPICQKAYRTPLCKRTLVEDSVAEMLRDDIIEPSCSPWASPITLVPKKDNTTRFCIDYRKLNAETVKDTYPLPLIADIFDQMGGNTIFSTLDLKSGYWQLPVAMEDRPKTAFRCHLGLFQCKRIPFGLCNAPAFFQRTMDKVLAGLIGVCVCVYLDDIIVYSKNMADHEYHLQCVFDRLREANLKLKPTKCAFGLKEVKLLGYILNADGIRTDPEKVQAIKEMSPPKTVSDVRRFLGCCGYYRQCLNSYAETSAPLVELTRKHQRFEWTDRHQKAFDDLKRLLISSHVMTAPDTSKPYKLYTDACDYAIGAILVQVADDGVEKVIQYVSHILSPTQRNWPCIERECYSVIFSITKLRPYLYGASFEVLTDHKPLLSLFTKEMNNTKIQRWGVLLAEYGASIKYRKGKNNIRADMLSRLRNEGDECTECEDIAIIDTEEYVDPQAFMEDDIADTLPLIHDGLNLETVAKEQRAEFPDLWKQGADQEDEEYQLIRGVLYSIKRPSHLAPEYPRLVLPQTYRNAVIDRAHKEVGHMAVWKTMRRISEAYVWTGLRRSIRKRLQVCPTCLIHSRRKDHVQMYDCQIPVAPQQLVSADLIGPLPESTHGNRYALTMICHCTGWAEVYPLRDKTNKSVWEKFANEFIPRHGVPETLITDRGSEFTSYEWESYLAQLGVRHNVTTPVHPSSNGKSERFNRSLKEILQKLIHNTPSDWEDRLGDALLAYRNAVSTTTGHTPFYLMYGRHARAPLTKMLSTTQATTFGNRLDDLSTALKSVRTMTEDSRHYNRARLARKANAKQLSVGDSVVIKAEERTALTSRWDPQYQIYRIRGPVVFVRHQQTGREKVLHREKVKLADPTISWDECNPRPLRAQYRPRIRREQNTARKVRRTEQVEVDATPTEEVSVPTRNGNDEASPSSSPQTSPKLKRRRRHKAPHRQADEQPMEEQPTMCNAGRPIRERRLSRRARDLIESDLVMDTDDINPVTRYFLKRGQTQAHELEEEAKRRRWEEVSSFWFYWP